MKGHIHRRGEAFRWSPNQKYYCALKSEGCTFLVTEDEWRMFEEAVAILLEGGLLLSPHTLGGDHWWIAEGGEEEESMVVVASQGDALGWDASTCYRLFFLALIER